MTIAKNKRFFFLKLGPKRGKIVLFFKLICPLFFSFLDKLKKTITPGAGLKNVYYFLCADFRATLWNLEQLVECLFFLKNHSTLHTTRSHGLNSPVQS